MPACIGCGKDMSEYKEEAQEMGWCVSCAPEQYEYGDIEGGV